MKLKYEFAISTVAGETVAVSVGAGKRNMVIKLNETAELLFGLLAEGAEVSSLSDALMEKYDELDQETARAEAEEFVELLRSNQLLDE
jgi:hypothetical protein